MEAKKKKIYTMFRPTIYSRHPTHSNIRRKNKAMGLLPFRSVVRLGSTTAINDSISKGGNRVELNTVDAIRNSSSKLRMKDCFTQNNVKTADWFKADNNLESFSKQIITGNETIMLEDMPLPLVVKSYYGSRGQGNSILNTIEEVRNYLRSGVNLQNRIFERYYNYSREYRLHVDANGCFYTCRKMMKRDTPNGDKWFRNDANCVWITEDSESGLFDKPSNWNDVVVESVKALKAVGLDFGAIDLRIQSATDVKGNRRESPDFIVVEINSAPSFGDVTTQKYIEHIPVMLKNKYKNG
tara:strand:- start:80357 stop:81247 length:891 start_codon:yes stop_codon:yes gene_type:complete